MQQQIVNATPNPGLLEIQRRIALYATKEQDSLRAIQQAANALDEPTARLELQKLLAFAELRQSAEQLVSPPAADAPTTYMAGSMFLYDCHRELIRGPNERMHYVSGLRLGNTFTLDRINSFALDEASPVSASGNLASSHNQLMRLSQFGHRLHGLFHSHPGRGKGATRPSSTDLGTQELQERGGYPVIGGIFVADGYVRFFSARNRFQILVYGEGVEHVEENVYRLTEIN